MAVADQRAIITYDHNEIDTLINNRLRQAYELAGQLPAEQRDQLQQNINSAYEGATSLSKLLTQSTSILKSAERYVEDAATVANEMQNQRDAVADELSDLLNDIANVNMFNRVIADFYQRSADLHNKAFSQSLPYDIAATMGDDWDFMDANALYSVMTLDLDDYAFDDADEDVVLSEYGFSQAALVECRQTILQAVRKLQGKAL